MNVRDDTSPALDSASVRLFLCGDVMTGRGIDQILPHPSAPELHEDFVRDARDYVLLAERRSGWIPKPVTPEYVWGAALSELEQRAPDARIVNLETSITRSDDWVDKGINYRMHPDNVGCLTTARIDVCALANNHVLDYGYAGLLETLEVLERAGCHYAGAGRTLSEAYRPARLPLRSGTLRVFSVGTPSSGIPESWAAGQNRPGVALLPEVSESAAEELVSRIRRDKGVGDLVVVSIHWGPNWGYELPRAWVEFAHRLVEGGVDLVHGHSSHHPRAIEVYRGKLVLYGCGDFVTDYEGIEGYEEYRGDLAPMYFATLEPHSGRLLDLRLRVMQSRRLRLERATSRDVSWLERMLSTISAQFGTRFETAADGTIALARSAP
ncbi:MAG: CapA family protein [Pseudomonadota bacterium]